MNMRAFDNDMSERAETDQIDVEVVSRDFTLDADALPSWRDAKAALERWLLTEALRRSGGNMAAAGRLLGVTKVAVLHAVRRHGLESLTRHQ